VAEAVGTAALLYVGILVLNVAGGGTLVEVALAHGLTIAVMASATMHISGGQFNPAVTVGLLATRKIGPRQALVNIVAQLLGGLVGAYLALVSLGGADITAGVPDLGAGVGIGQAILVEAVLTFFLMFVIFGTVVDGDISGKFSGKFSGKLAGLAIGLTVTLDILAGGPLTGAALNPARWLAAAIPAGHYANAVVYFVGPIAGALAAALLYEHVLMDKAKAAA